MSSLACCDRRRGALQITRILAAILLVFFPVGSSAAQEPDANRAAPKILEEKFAFPPPLQWKIGEVEISVVGLAWGPANSPEMIAKGHEVKYRVAPAFFPDKTYVLAVHLRTWRQQLNQGVMQSNLARVTDVDGNVEYAWLLTPSGFVDVHGAAAPQPFNLSARTIEFWDFFPVLPEQRDFLFQVTPYYTKKTELSFRVLVRGNKLVLADVSPGPEPAIPDFSKQFRGSVGAESAVNWQLTKTGSQLSGTEQYAHVGKTLWLKGAIDSLGNIELKEYYPRDQLTGIFAGKISRNGEVAGYFSKPDGSELQPFQLKEVVPPPPPEQESSNGGPPCSASSTQTGWKVYVNQKYGFCFWYPPNYEPSAEPWSEEYTHNPIYSEQLHSAAREDRELRLVDQNVPLGSDNPQAPHPYINIYLKQDAFDINKLLDPAVVECCGGPVRKQIGDNVFYYSGPLGGGVAYPEGFFTNLKGHTLEFVFDGPYHNDNTPTPETKQIEKEMLESFRMF